MKKTGNSKKTYMVSVNVKNGPFSSQTAAKQAQAVLTSRGISTSVVKHIAKGWFFISIVKYKCPNSSIRDKVIRNINSFSKTSGMSPSLVKITSKIV